jgi:hypothetical protein
VIAVPSAKEPEYVLVIFCMIHPLVLLVAQPIHQRNWP